MLDLSIVIPAYNEAESLPELVSQIETNINALGISYDIIFVDDGSNDGTLDILRSLKSDHPNI